MSTVEYVLGFAFSKNRETVVLMKKNRPEWQAGKLNGIGGKIEKGEFRYAAMNREFEEETGVKLVDTPWTYFCALTKKDEFIVHVFCLFDDIVLTAKTTEDEEVIIMPVDFNIIAKLGNPNVHSLIGLALDRDNKFIDIEYF